MIITINTENAAFHPRPEHEVARILREMAARIRRDGALDIPLPMDINGNKVVELELTTAENPQTTFAF